MSKAHGYAWELAGEIMQAAIVTLKPGQSVVGEAGAMLYIQESIELDTGLSTRSDSPSIMEGLLEAAKRKLAGDSFFVTHFRNTGRKAAEVAFAAPFPGTILHLDLDSMPEGVVLQKDAFLCGSEDIRISLAFQTNILAGLFSGGGFILQRITSEEKGAAVLAHACGTLIERTLADGELLRIDAGCVVAYEPSVQFDVKLVGNVSTMLFGGHGAFFATLQGPGRIWVQTMPFSRLAARIWDAAPQRRRLEQEQVRVARVAADEAVRTHAKC
jgi:uncharacterized protein (TIGR00266 family)